VLACLGWGLQRRVAAEGSCLMSDQKLHDEIRGRLKDVPSNGSVDPLAWATDLANYFATSMEDIQEIIAIECTAAGIS